MGNGGAQPDNFINLSFKPCTMICCSGMMVGLPLAKLMLKDFAERLQRINSAFAASSALALSRHV